MSELPLSRENPIHTYINRASKIVAGRYEKVIDPIKEASTNLLNRRRLPLALTAAIIIANAGCGNAENPIQMPVFGEAPVAAGTPLPPEPQATVTPSPTDKLKYKDRLPADVVSEKELWEQYHTRIWNTDKVKLHLRRGALENEPIFEDLHRIVAGGEVTNLLTSWDPQTFKIEHIITPLNAQLDVVLIPGRVIRSIKMTEEQKQSLPYLYGRLKGDEFNAWLVAKREIAQKGPSYIQDLKRAIDATETEYREGKMSKERYDSHIGFLAERIGIYTEDLAKYDFDSFYDKYGFMPGYKHAAGLYLGRFGQEAQYDEKGKIVGYIQRYYIPIAISESGIDESLDPNKSSFIDPTAFSIRSDPTYPLVAPYEASTSVTTRHEFGHHESDHPYTDYLVLENYQRAYDRFLEGDDSLFYFVFETPRGNVVAQRTDSDVGNL